MTEKLTMSWSKRTGDIIYKYHSKVDGSLLHYIFTRRMLCETNPEWHKSNTVFVELDKRGYDLTTIKFSIEKKKTNIRTTAPWMED